MGGATVPVVVARFANTSGVSATIQSLVVGRTGTTPDQAFDSLVVTDSQGAVVGSVAQASTSPFNANHVAVVPLTWTLPGDATSALTVSARMEDDISAYGGSGYTLHVVSVNTLAGVTITGQFPIVGAVYTIPPPAQRPRCAIGAAPALVQAGSRARLQWISQNTVSGSIDNGVGNIIPTGSLYVTPSKTTTFTATFNGPGGTATCRTTLVVIPFGTGGSGSGWAWPPEGGGAGGTTGLGGTPTLGETPGLGQEPTLGTTPGLGQTPTLGQTPQLSPGSQTPGLPLFTQGTLTPDKPGLGIVPLECQSANGNSVVLKCTICQLGQLVQNVVNFLLGLSILVAAIMFAYAGYLYFTSGGSQTKISDAHKVFYSVGIGFVIALAAWLFVQTLLNTLVGNTNFFGNIGGSWNRLECGGLQRRTDLTVADWLRSSLPSLSQIRAVPSATPTCPPNSTPVVTMETFSCRGPNGETVQPIPAGGATGSTGATASDSTNRRYFTDNGILVVSNGNCADRTQTNCTSLDGLQPNAVSGALQMQESCGGCLVVTGGTEAGHAGGLYSHASGYKLDFQINDRLNNYIQGWGTPVDRGDGPTYTNGNISCTRESSPPHWDCTYR